MSDRDRKSSRRTSSPPRSSGRDVRDVRDRDVRDVRDGGSSSSRYSRRDKSRSPDRRGGRDGGSRRSRSRERSRDRDERRERRKKKGSGWDQPPDASAPQPAAAASNPAFAGLHPARIAQLMAMGQMPTGPSQADRFENEQRGGGGSRGGGGGGGFDAHRDVRESRGGGGRSPPRGGGGFGGAAAAAGFGGGGLQYSGGLLPNGGRDNPAALLPGASSQTPQQIASRQLRRLYVGNLLPDTTEDDLRVFFSKAMAAANPNLEPGDSVISVYLNLPKKFGFLEMRTPDEATLCLALDSIQFRGQTLKVRRPSDYNPAQQYAAIGQQAPAHALAAAPAPAPSLAALQGLAGGAAAMGAAALPGGGGDQPWNGITSTQVPDGPNKVFCGGLPYSLTEAEVKELLAVYGPLRAFHLVRDKDANQSKGFCFFEYVSPAITDDAVKGLNGLEIRGKTLTVRRAQARAAMQQGAAAAGLGALGLGANPLLGALPGLAGLPGLNPALLAAAGLNPAALGLPGLAGLGVPAAPAQPATRVLCLTQMVSAEELASDSEYKEISEDIEGECRKYGDLKSVVIPRPAPGQDAAAAAAAGVGKVFVEYSESSMAAKARADLEGRQFGARTVACTYWDEQRFANKDYA